MTFCSAVFAQLVEPPCCCSFGSAFDSNVFGVSFWFFWVLCVISWFFRVLCVSSWFFRVVCVSGWFENEFFLFQKWLNSVVICYFCVDLFRAPKIMKFFAWHLCDVYYLGKILNVVFQYILNMIKIAQLINKWVSIIFLGLINYPKIMKIVLPLSYHVMNLYKNLSSIGTSWFIS